MNDLINKTVVTETGIALCRPDIFALNIEKVSMGSTAVCLCHNGDELIRFILDEQSLDALLQKLRAN